MKSYMVLFIGLVWVHEAAFDVVWVARVEHGNQALVPAGRHLLKGNQTFVHRVQRDHVHTSQQLLKLSQ